MVKLLQYQLKLVSLWTAFLLGLLFHTQLALMPIFHGVDVAASDTHQHLPLDNIFGLMLLFYAIPLAMIVLSPFFKFRRGHRINFGITLVYSILNILHFGFDIVVRAPFYQLILMLILVGIGIGLNWVTFAWMKQHRRSLLHQPIG